VFYWWNRLVTAFRAGITAYNQGGSIPVGELGWNTKAARDYRYALADLYVNNLQYRQLTLLAASPDARKIDQRLYKHIRSIFNPSDRAVEI
jgi:hypothetical protein